MDRQVLMNKIELNSEHKWNLNTMQIYVLGTGKTYLVSKLAKLWHLRMICVKGPELLAKFIGQSEENVRNLFDKARSAKPCVLFFDEFDSLAPRYVEKIQQWVCPFFKQIVFLDAVTIQLVSLIVW